jgi:ferredoxin
MRVVVDFDRCDSTGLCAAIAPELFELDDDDRLHVRGEQVEPAQRRVAEEAAKACPKLAITVRDGS